MEALPIVKLVIDLALAGAVLYLAARVGRRGGPSPAQIVSLQTLEASLARLLKEADGASSDLQSALTKEQKKLEELLFDIETVEHRVNKGLDEAQNFQRNLRRVTTQHQQPLEAVSAERQYETPEPARQSVKYEEPIVQAAPIAPQRDVPRNIYGDPIAPDSYDAPRQAPLRESIEREVTPQRETPPTFTPVQQSLEDIYAQCEDLLRAGNTIQQVANSMNLSIDEIETLQKFMSVDDEPATVGGRSAGSDDAVVRASGRQDSRLGALSATSGRTRNPIGRATQVI